MQTYTIPCGKKPIPIQIPDHIQVEWVASHTMQPVPNVEKAIEEAIQHPIGSPRLRDFVKPWQKVALIVTDITRKLPEEIILPILIKELLTGGIKKSDITAIVATGTHRPNTPEELNYYRLKAVGCIPAASRLKVLSNAKC